MSHLAVKYDVLGEQKFGHSLIDLQLIQYLKLYMIQKTLFHKDWHRAL